MLLDTNNVPGRSPSPWRVVVISGAFAVFASAMTPAFAAEPLKHKAAAGKHWRKPALAKRLGNTAGGGSGNLSLEWTISAMLRP